MVEKLITAKGKTNDNGAVNFVLQHLGEAVPQAEQERDGKFDMVPITSRTTRLFLGLQTQCVQCHDHPFNPDWKQSNFWGDQRLLSPSRARRPTEHDGAAIRTPRSSNSATATK